MADQMPRAAFGLEQELFSQPRFVASGDGQCWRLLANSNCLFRLTRRAILLRQLLFFRSHRQVESRFWCICTYVVRDPTENKSVITSGPHPNGTAIVHSLVRRPPMNSLANRLFPAGTLLQQTQLCVPQRSKSHCRI
jgi:hypothetical protein